MNITTIVLQTPVGDYLDFSTLDRWIVATAMAVAALTTMAVAWTSELWSIMLIKAVEATAAAFLRPGLMSLLLGVVPSADVPKAGLYAAARAQMASHP